MTDRLATQLSSVIVRLNSHNASCHIYSEVPLSGNLFCMHFLVLILGTRFAPFNSACAEAMLKPRQKCNSATYTGIGRKWRPLEADGGRTENAVYARWRLLEAGTLEADGGEVDQFFFPQRAAIWARKAPSATVASQGARKRTCTGLNKTEKGAEKNHKQQRNHPQTKNPKRDNPQKQTTKTKRKGHPTTRKSTISHVGPRQLKSHPRDKLRRDCTGTKSYAASTSTNIINQPSNRRILNHNLPSTFPILLLLSSHHPPFLIHPMHFKMIIVSTYLTSRVKDAFFPLFFLLFRRARQVNRSRLYTVAGKTKKQTVQGLLESQLISHSEADAHQDPKSFACNQVLSIVNWHCCPLIGEPARSQTRVSHSHSHNVAFTIALSIITILFLVFFFPHRWFASRFGDRKRSHSKSKG